MVLQDSSVRKAALLVHYVDLHNDYVLDARKSKAKFLELFQSFRYSVCSYKLLFMLSSFPNDFIVTILHQNLKR